MMLRISFIILNLLFFTHLAFASEELKEAEQIHTHIESGVVYCDVQAFNHESYFLNVLGAGSALTVYWQFNVRKISEYWIDQAVVTVRLGRQVIPDLVTKRWLMRDLSSGVVRYTAEIEEAMNFLSAMNHAAVVDVSVLDAESKYWLEAKLYSQEGTLKEDGWWTSLINWGEKMGSVAIKLHEDEVDGAAAEVKDEQ